MAVGWLFCKRAGGGENGVGGLQWSVVVLQGWGCASSSVSSFVCTVGPARGAGRRGLPPSIHTPHPSIPAVHSSIPSLSTHTPHLHDRPAHLPAREPRGAVHPEEGRVLHEQVRDGAQVEHGHEGEEEEEAVDWWWGSCGGVGGKWGRMRRDGVGNRVVSHARTPVHRIPTYLPLGAAGWCAASATVRRKGEKPRRSLMDGGAIHSCGGKGG